MIKSMLSVIFTLVTYLNLNVRDYLNQNPYLNILITTLSLAFWPLMKLLYLSKKNIDNHINNTINIYNNIDSECRYWDVGKYLIPFRNRYSYIRRKH